MGRKERERERDKGDGEERERERERERKKRIFFVCGPFCRKTKCKSDNISLVLKLLKTFISKSN